MGERLRESGKEYGASTGRPRRCGWFDAVAVRYAGAVNGLDAIALTKLDVLDGLDEIEVAVGLPDRRPRVDEFPADAAARRRPASRSTRHGPAGRAPTKGATRFDDAARRRAPLRRAAGRGERRADRASSPPARTGRRRSSRRSPDRRLAEVTHAARGLALGLGTRDQDQGIK